MDLCFERTGAVADFLRADADVIRPFWRVGLGYREQLTAVGTLELHHPSGRGPVLWFQPMDPARYERSRFHLAQLIAHGCADLPERGAAGR
jgi:hypothetical protein